MTYPRIGRAFQLPLDSNKSAIEQVSVLSTGSSTILCIRTSAHRLQLICFRNRSETPVINSLQLSLPKETSNQVISAYLVSISPKLIINVLTLAGTLITLDATMYLVKGNLPENVKMGNSPIKNLVTDEDGKDTNCAQQMSLYDLSVDGGDKCNAKIPKLGMKGLSQNKFEEHLPSRLTLEQTLKLATTVEDLGIMKQTSSCTPSCMISLQKRESALTSPDKLSEGTMLPGSRTRIEDSHERSAVTSFIGCSDGIVLMISRQVWNYSRWTFIDASNIDRKRQKDLYFNPNKIKKLMNNVLGISSIEKKLPR